jgi:hypothetical protein
MACARPGAQGAVTLAPGSASACRAVGRTSWGTGRRFALRRWRCMDTQIEVRSWEELAEGCVR